MLENVNSTTNGTQQMIMDCFSNPTAAKIVGIFTYCLIFVVSLAGNIFIGIIVYKTKSMRKPINFLIVNMAMSDLLFPIFTIPERLTWLLVDSWLIGGPLGQTLCKLAHFLRDVSLAVSIQSLVWIAVDRFGAVVFPLRSPLISSKRCPYFILVTWIVAMAICTPYVFANKLVEHPGGFECVGLWIELFQVSSSFENYMLAMFAGGICTPLVFIAILYTIIYVKLKTQAIPGEQSANARQQRVKRERNVLKMAIAVVLGFAVCFLPFSIVFFLVHLASDTWSCGFIYFAIVAQGMFLANCAINPCICFLFSKNYRQGLRNLFSCF